MSKNLNVALDKIYDERKDFIIIGLTGRTGAGCSTIASLLSKSFYDLAAPQPKREDFKTNEERKYSVVYQYANKNWEKFHIIEMRNIITSFILEEEYVVLEKFLLTIFDTQQFQQVKSVFESKIKDEFEEMHTKRLQVKSLIEESEENLVEEEVYEFYFDKLIKFTCKLKENLDNIDKQIYTRLYQIVANNIRSSGKALCSEFNAANIFMLAQRTNVLVKILRKRNKQAKKLDKNFSGRVLVVIDAFRNPYEAVFFKDRYASFYLFSINAEEEERRRRLTDISGLNKEQIMKIDQTEYPDKLSGEKKFWSQNIQSCIELSDVYIYNPTADLREFSEIKSKLIKYITLIMHPGLISPTHIERSMQIAYNAKLNSGCLSRQVGAVVTDENYSIKSVGWNTVPECQIPCNLRNLKRLVRRQDKEAFSEYELDNEEFTESCQNVVNMIDDNKLNGRSYHYCFKDIYNKIEGKKNQVHTRSLHAEENAFLQISKYGGIGIMGGNLFTTASPCELCAKKAYQLGIKNIYYIDPYPGISKQHIFGNGSRKPQMILFEGAIGKGFTQLYTQIMPYKDELEMLMQE